MIQRIQSIFLALAAVVNASVFFFPFASTDKTMIGSALFANDTLYNYEDNIAFPIVFGLIIVLALVSIFTFHDRKKQMFWTRIGILASILALILMVVFFWRDYSMISTELVLSDGVAAYLPFVGLILFALGHRSIIQDEKLVRSSYDRLR